MGAPEFGFELESAKQPENLSPRLRRQRGSAFDQMPNGHFLATTKFLVPI